MSFSEKYSDFETINFENFAVSEKNHETVIFDSSVVFKWFHFEKENDLETSKKLHEKTISKYYHALAPELLIYEITSICRFRTDMDLASFKKILDEISNILIFIKLQQDDFAKAYDLSRKTGSSIYDAIYVSISEKYRADFITADIKLYEVFKPLNFRIKMLEDFL